MFSKYSLKTGLIAVAVSAILVIPAFTLAEDAPPTGGDSIDAAVSIPVTGGGSVNAAVPNQADPSTAAPSTGGDTVNAGVPNQADPSTSAPTTGGDNTSGAVSVPATTDNTGGNEGNGGGGGGGGGNGGSVSSGGGSAIILPLISGSAGTSTCPLLTSYLQFGRTNNAIDVTKLQAFLKSQGFTVTVNGTFDLETLNAVKAFQSKYVVEIMGPWGASMANGNVYITTQKKINEIACNRPFALSLSDLAIINAYVNRPVFNGAAIGAPGTTTGPVLEIGTDGVGSTTGSSTTDQDIGLNDRSSETAAVGNTSFLSRLWNFIVGLF